MKKEEIVETMEWKNKNEGIIHIIKENEIKDNNKVIGTKKEEMHIKTNIDDLKDGLALVQSRLDNNRKQLIDLETQMKDSNPKALTQEQLRLKDNLDALHKSMEFEKLKNKAIPIKEMISNDELFIKNRQSVIDSQPHE